MRDRALPCWSTRLLEPTFTTTVRLAMGHHMEGCPRLAADSICAIDCPDGQPVTGAAAALDRAGARAHAGRDPQARRGARAGSRAALLRCRPDGGREPAGARDVAAGA